MILGTIPTSMKVVVVNTPIIIYDLAVFEYSNPPSIKSATPLFDASVAT